MKTAAENGLRIGRRVQADPRKNLRPCGNGRYWARTQL